MFLGEYQHTLDAKGRVVLPASFRSELPEGSVMARKIDGCLAVYPSSVWTDVATQAREWSRKGSRERQAARALFAGATPLNPDRQGRIVVPQHLREYAGLGRDVVVAGMDTHVEIWDTERWREQRAEGERSLAGAADDLRDLGI
jgi:transcriptional regulator MraZ